MPQDRAAVLGVDGHRVDLVAVGELVSEVAQLAADPGGDHCPVVREEVRGRGAGGDLALAAGDVDADLGHGRTPSVRWSCGPRDRIDRRTPSSPAFRQTCCRGASAVSRGSGKAPPRRRLPASVKLPAGVADATGDDEDLDDTVENAAAVEVAASREGT